MGVYRIADFRVRLHNKHAYTDRLCADYAAQGEQADFDVQVTAEEVAAEQALTGQPEPLCESVCLYRKLCGMLVSQDIFLLHAAVVEVGGLGYAFLGESGTGKSTHMSLWLEYLPATIVNGDKPLVRRIEGEDGTPVFMAYGTPWAGKENLQSNRSVPLAAIVFLEQAKRNEIARLDTATCVKQIFKQLLMPRTATDVSKLLGLVDGMVRHVPAYHLSCDISREAAELCYHTIVLEKTGGSNK